MATDEMGRAVKWMACRQCHMVVGAYDITDEQYCPICKTILTDFDNDKENWAEDFFPIGHFDP